MMKTKHEPFKLQMTSHYTEDVLPNAIVYVNGLTSQIHFLIEHSDSQFESIRRFILGESIRFVKKSAIWFGRCIRLINDGTPWHSPILRRCISHSAVQLILLTLRLREVVRVTHDDGVELTFDNIVNDSRLYACKAVMCWIESKKSISFGKSNQNIFFWIGTLYFPTADNNNYSYCRRYVQRVSSIKQDKLK